MSFIFKEEEGVILYKNKNLPIIMASLEYDLLRVLLSFPNERIDQEDILEKLDSQYSELGKEKRQVAKKQLFDTYKRLNKRLKQHFGIKELISKIKGTPYYRLSIPNNDK